MSLCENEKNQNGGRTGKNILSLYENENLKKRDRKKVKKKKEQKKEQKHLCPNIMNSPTLFINTKTH
jgi:hypothetical protein